MAHHWVSTPTNHELPRFAITGGNDGEGKTTYVGRCYHEGNLLPALITPENDSAYVTWAGEIHIKDEYEILVGPGYGWAPCQYGGVPRYAVSSGNCSNGDPLYIGRGHYEGIVYVGRVHIKDDCLIIPFDGELKNLWNYEVLVQAPPDRWLSASLKIPPPPDAVLAGNERDGTAIYVARAMHDGVMLPAKFVPERGEAYVVSDDFEIHKKQEIEVLCGSNYTWLRSRTDNVPANAIFTGRRHDGDPMIVGRARYKRSTTPGLLSVDGSSVLIPFGETVVRVDNCEVLIKHHP